MKSKILFSKETAAVNRYIVSSFSALKEKQYWEKQTKEKMLCSTCYSNKLENLMRNRIFLMLRWLTKAVTEDHEQRRPCEERSHGNSVLFSQLSINLWLSNPTRAETVPGSQNRWSGWAKRVDSQFLWSNITETAQNLVQNHSWILI